MKKSLETLLYVADRAPNATIFYVGHLVYLANKLHLERYGRSLTDDPYARMKDGPVPSVIYDLFKDVRDNRKQSRHFTIAFAALRKPTDRQSVIPKRRADLGVFSESDLECLNESIERFSGLTFNQLKSLTHDAAYDKAKERGKQYLDLSDIVDQLEDAASLKAHIGL